MLRRVAALAHHLVMPHALLMMEWRLRPAGSWKDVAIAKSKRGIAPDGQAALAHAHNVNSAALTPRARATTLQLPANETEAATSKRIKNEGHEQIEDCLNHLRKAC